MAADSTRWTQPFNDAVDDGVSPADARALADQTVADERFAEIVAMVGKNWDEARKRNVPDALVGVPVPTHALFPDPKDLADARAREARLLAEYDRAVAHVARGGT
jgi:hypothetical protein